MIDFPLFTMLKEDLPKNYAITAKDIGLIARLNQCISVNGKKETIQNILGWFLKLDAKEVSVLYNNIHCDPYELFIDAGRINTECKIIVD